APAAPAPAVSASRTSGLRPVPAAPRCSRAAASAPCGGPARCSWTSTTRPRSFRRAAPRGVTSTTTSSFGREGSAMPPRDVGDPILLELIKNALDAIVDEMAIALVRTAYSNNLKNAMDMSCALCDAEGRLIAQGLTLPLHLGSIPDAMAQVRRKFVGRIEPGDVFILNDPFEGGTHLPDFYIFKPIFLDGGLVGWSASIGHQLDVGGKTPGGNGCDATEIFQEGLRIPPLKLYDAGRPVDAIFELIDRNVRVPRQVLGAINSPLPFTKSAVYACVRHLIGGEPPNNEGYFRPIEVIAPAGTVVNPVQPAAVAARGLTGFRMANTMFGALAQIAPDRVFACEMGGDTGVSFGGYDAERRPFVFLEFLFGSWGGRPTRDGVDACSRAVVNFSNNPIEA